MGLMHYYALYVNKIPVGVLWASGYAGRELCALIQRHPGLTLSFATANEQRGTTVRVGARELTFIAPDDAPLGSVELVGHVAQGELPTELSRAACLVLPSVTTARDR